MAYKQIFNFIQIDETTATAGQPTEEQLESLAAAGYKTVINLATLDPRYSLADEGRSSQSLGMIYHHIPVIWEAPTEADFAAFEKVMLALPAGKTLVHCYANYRVTAFYGLFALKHLGWSEQQLDELRSQIWAGSDFPIWEKFVADMKQTITR